MEKIFAAVVWAFWMTAGAVSRIDIDTILVGLVYLVWSVIGYMAFGYWLMKVWS